MVVLFEGLNWGARDLPRMDHISQNPKSTDSLGTIGEITLYCWLVMNFVLLVSNLQPE